MAISPAPAWDRTDASVMGAFLSLHFTNRVRLTLSMWNDATSAHANRRGFPRKIGMSSKPALSRRTAGPPLSRGKPRRKNAPNVTMLS